jgi:hypothetical protein
MRARSPVATPAVPAGDAVGLGAVVRRTCLLFVLWRGLFLLALVVGRSLSGDFAGSYEHTSEWQFVPGHDFLNGFFRWDAYWYDLIAREGYGPEGDRAQAAVFFPLYPTLARLAGPVFGSHLIAGLVISNAATLVGLVYVYRIGLLFHDRLTVERAIVFLLCFPAAIFYMAFYTEGLYLALTAAFFFYLLRGQHGRAALAGILATLCRPTGVLVLLAALAAAAVHAAMNRARPPRSFYALLLVPLGIGAYMVHLQAQTGDPLAFAHMQGAHWARTAQLPWTPLVETLRSLDWSFPRDARNTQIAINAGTLVAFAGAGAWLLARRTDSRGWPLFGLYVLGGALLPLVTGSTDSAVRYCSVLFPAFFLLADKARSRVAETAVTGAFAMGSVVYGLGFMNKFWVV